MKVYGFEKADDVVKVFNDDLDMKPEYVVFILGNIKVSNRDFEIYLMDVYGGRPLDDDGLIDLSDDFYKSGERELCQFVKSLVDWYKTGCERFVMIVE